MRPIRQIPGIDAAPAFQPDGLEITPSRSSPLDQPRSRSVGSARIEDIVGVAPIVTSVNHQPIATSVRPEYWSNLRRSIMSADSVEQLLRTIHSQLQKPFSASLISCFTFEDLARSTVRTSESNSAVLSQEVRGLLKELCEQATASQQCVIRRASDSEVGIAACPVRPSGEFLVVFNAASMACDQLTHAVEFTAAAMGEWLAINERRDATNEVEHVAALIELLGRVSSCRSLKSAARCAADTLQKHLGADEVAIGFSGDGTHHCRLLAVSDRAEFAPLSDHTRMLEAALQESLTREASAIWPSRDSSNRHALRCHEQLAENIGATYVVSSPLRVDDDNNVGAVVVAFAAGEDDVVVQNRTLRTQQFLAAGEMPLATALESVRRVNQPVAARIASRIWKAVKSNAMRTIAAVVGVITSIMFIPVDYVVDCQSELQPVLRRYVAAPFNAPLMKCFVEPGDVVEADQVLAELDGRELRWELAGINADLSKATREHDAYLSEQEFGRAAIARHEMERLQNRAALLTDRTRGLEIRSPMAGIIVAGDLKDSEGVPLETGDSLFEVAPLDNMLIEVFIPEDDIRHVTEGMKIELTLDAMPSEIFNARIERIHPKATLKDHENVFIAEAVIETQAQWLRPGMRGESGVSTGARALGWNLFHKPVAYVRGWLGW